MRFEFEHLGSLTSFEVMDGQHLLGGGVEDQIRLEGLPPGLLVLCIEGSRLTVKSAQPFTVNDVLVPPGLRRLVLPGEGVGLPQGMRLKVLPASPGNGRCANTVAVLKHLLTASDEPPPSSAATLTCLTGLDTGRSFPLAGAKTDIGRGSRSDLLIRDRTVSRAHARIHQDGSTVTVAPLSPHNGLYVNGQRVERSRPLLEGDVLELGQTLLRFQASLEAPVPLAPPVQEPAHDAAQQTRPGGEGWFLGMGAVMTLAGLLVTYALLG
ncbi:FHA domain-containing protein [Stigmatella sp. ncwal1]|uniref:FHA domain-containing protein n=1 Tax=Stigmatella ashevillensis TaxID=2995309 RepID=A0ABT5DMX2_9BACT|nr:FHA domain-containing protein [Stigmatella ashevillena]MDC0715005.1 FHA domain-containing protein [Stigmatella ashevillena]